jgi:hypothetical protein
MSDRIPRRIFLKSGAVAAALGAASGRAAEPTGEPSADVYREPAREIPIVEQADVVVCGAGPAGVAAAIAAARAGAKTRLLEAGGCLGGIWTAGLLSWILDAANKSGLMRTMLDRLDQRKALAPYGHKNGYDVEEMKLVLDEMCLEAGVKIQLHTRAVAAVRDESNRLKLVVSESKSSRQAWAAKVFVDATGDGDLAAQAGCGFDYGREGTGETQPMSLLVLVAGLDPEQVKPFVVGMSKEAKRQLLDEMGRAGVSPSYAHPSLFCIRPGLFCLMANHEYGVSAVDAQQITDATLRARSEVHKLVNALRGMGGVWKDVRIVASASQIGVREGRRIHGLYRITRDDVAQGTQHEDAVCRATFPVDIHSTNPTKAKTYGDDGVRVKPYDIPYRALIARDVQGLLLAGRLISGDFIAHASYRVTGDAVPMGEAAGIAAALAARSDRLPQNVPWAEIGRAVERSAASAPEGSKRGV